MKLFNYACLYKRTADGETLFALAALFAQDDDEAVSRGRAEFRKASPDAVVTSDVAVQVPDEMIVARGMILCDEMLTEEDLAIAK